MLSTASKPRWLPWQNICLTTAFKHHIQLKVIAAALNKSVTSVSKKITKLGLREEKSTHTLCPDWEARMPQDVEKMAELVSQYAPMTHSTSLQWKTRAHQWTLTKTHSKKRKASARHCSLPQDPLYVSLCHIEEWALSKGFHPTKSALRNHGLAYWKDGKYFSKAQLLVYVNGLRFEQKLTPLRLYEEEMEA